VLLISLPTLSLNAVILAALNPGKLDAEGFADIVKIFFLTAPLCVSVVVLLLAIEQPWFRGFGALFAAAGILAGGVIVGTSLGYAIDISPERVLGTTANDSGPAQAIDVNLTVIVGYIQTYGIWTFLRDSEARSTLHVGREDVAIHFRVIETRAPRNRLTGLDASV
jgi:hypothetical protein